MMLLLWASIALVALLCLGSGALVLLALSASSRWNNTTPTYKED